MALFSLRTLAERMSRGKAFWRRLPSEFGHAPLLVSPDAALQLVKFGDRAFDPMLLRLCDEYVENGSIVWDIGANVGIFTLAAAQRGGRVLAIEPDVFLYSLLCKTRLHQDNKPLLFEPLCAAISAQSGTARLAIASRGRASNFLEEFEGRSQTGGARFTTLVPLLTLDSLLKGHTAPTLIKIDVEGAEEAVLTGATKILTAIRPTILIEVGQETSENIILKFKKHNYQLFDYESGQQVNNSDASPANRPAIPM